VTAGDPARESAIRRLATARAEASRLGDVHDAAEGGQPEALAQHRLSEARANVASREQWLHWVEEGESLAPRADGEWGPQADTTGANQTERGYGALRNIQHRASRRRIELAQAVSRSAKRVQALQRVTEVAAARRARARRPGARSQNDGSYDA
jgi:hypothetical protein